MISLSMLGLVELADDTYMAVLTPGPSSVVQLDQGWLETLHLPESGT